MKSLSKEVKRRRSKMIGMERKEDLKRRVEGQWRRRGKTQERLQSTEKSENILWKPYAPPWKNCICKESGI